MTTLPMPELLAQVHARLLAVAASKRDHADVDMIDALVNRLMNVHEHALLTQQAHAIADALPPGHVDSRLLARYTAAVTSRALLSACIDAAAVALHLASVVESEV